MQSQAVENFTSRKKVCNYNNLEPHFEKYIKLKKLNLNQKILINYKGTRIGFTERQIKVLKLIAKGLSNIKIAEKLQAKESAIKLLVYRLMKYLEEMFYERVDRYYLIIIAQELNLG